MITIDENDYNNNDNDKNIKMITHDDKDISTTIPTNHHFSLPPPFD